MRKKQRARRHAKWVIGHYTPSGWPLYFLDPPDSGGARDYVKAKRNWLRTYGYVPKWVQVWMQANGVIYRLEDKMERAGLAKDIGCWEMEFPSRTVARRVIAQAKRDRQRRATVNEVSS